MLSLHHQIPLIILDIWKKNVNQFSTTVSAILLKNAVPSNQYIDQFQILKTGNVLLSISSFHYVDEKTH